MRLIKNILALLILIKFKIEEESIFFFKKLEGRFGSKKYKNRHVNIHGEKVFLNNQYWGTITKQRISSFTLNLFLESEIKCNVVGTIGRRVLIIGEEKFQKVKKVYIGA